MAQPKVIAVLVVTAVVAVAAFLADQTMLALVVVAFGIAGTYLLLRSADALGGSEEFIEVEDELDRTEPRGSGSGGLSAWQAPAARDVEPLSAWTPGPDAGEPLTAWAPEEAAADLDEPPAPAPTAKARPEPQPRAPRSRPAQSRPNLDRSDSIFATPRSDVADDALAPFEPSPLEGWDSGGSSVAEVDEQAEIDRASRVLAGETQINEAVSTADDIMAASEATELHLETSNSGDDGELAKLLAKVQARLAAYE